MKVHPLRVLTNPVIVAYLVICVLTVHSDPQPDPLTWVVLAAAGVLLVGNSRSPEDYTAGVYAGSAAISVMLVALAVAGYWPLFERYAWIPGWAVGLFALSETIRHPSAAVDAHTS